MGKVDPLGQGDAAQLPPKGFVPIPTAPLVFAAATTVTRLVASYSWRKDDLTHPVGSLLVQGETHGQPKSPHAQAESRATHFFLGFFFRDCRRHSASSLALPAKTSAIASLNSRPCSTSGRICSTHSSGTRSTRFRPSARKVRDQTGCPSPSAHRQLGFPQRRCVRASEPGRASGGIRRLRSKACLRWRKRAAGSPLASYQFI